MSAPHQHPIRSKKPLTMRQRPSFDVTCTIGTVFLDEQGSHTPEEAAMLLIAQHGAPGTFRFPGPHSQWTVTVDHTIPED